MQKQKLAYSVAEFAELVGLSKSKVYELVRSEQIVIVRVGRRVLIPIKSADKFLGTSA